MEVPSQRKLKAKQKKIKKSKKNPRSAKNRVDQVSGNTIIIFFFFGLNKLTLLFYFTLQPYVEPSPANLHPTPRNNRRRESETALISGAMVLSPHSLQHLHTKVSSPFLLSLDDAWCSGVLFLETIFRNPVPVLNSCGTLHHANIIACRVIQLGIV